LAYAILGGSVLFLDLMLSLSLSGLDARSTTVLDFTNRGP